MARRAYKALGVRDLGRIDFRVAEDGQVYFIEINALPSLEPGAGIYAAAALEGLHTDAVLGKVVESAVARWGLKDPRRSGSRPPRRGPLRVGFTYNVKRVKPALDSPYSGSDPAALNIALDKALAKKIVRQHGILTPNFFTMNTGKERLPKDLRFPLIVKPIAEGSSKGVHATSVVENEGELREAAHKMIAKYDQPALVEDYIGGREFTVGMLGERRPKVLPPMEVVFLDESEIRPVYSFEFKQDSSSKIRYDVPAKLEPGQLKALERAAREGCIALGCRGVARVDFRMDEQGKVYFTECNPLPGLAPGWSDLVLIAKAAGMEYNALIADILSGAIRRYKERERERRESERGIIATPPSGNGEAVAPSS